MPSPYVLPRADLDEDVATKLQDRTLPVETITQVYQQILSLPSAPLTLRLCQWIHAAHRYRRSQYKKGGSNDDQMVAALDQERKSIEAFADDVATQMKEKKLAIHPWAILHLISFFKEAQSYAKGLELWSWAAKQEDENLSPAVYSAAIELLSESGGHSLQELEDLFLEGLRRWPGSFAEYHFSPNAIVPDRSRLTTIRGLPMALLQAVMVARVVHGNWRQAILTLDSALRLYPTSTPVMFFTKLILERPLTEAYHIAHMACRSLVPLQPATLTRVLKAIADLQPNFERKRELKGEELDESVRLFGALLELLAAYDGAGGALSAEHISVLINALSSMAINLQYAADTEESIIQKYVAYNRQLFGFAEQIVQLIGDVRKLHSLTAYNNLIVLAGKTKDKVLVGQYASKILDHGYQPTDVTFRSLINAAGKCGDLNTVSVSWNALLEKSTKQERSGPSRSDWMALAVAARDSGQVAVSAFVESVMAEHQVPDGLRTDIRHVYTRHFSHETLDPSLEDLDLTAGIATLTMAVSKFQHFFRHSQAGKHDFYNHPFQTQIFPKHTSFEADKTQLRRIYDEMTTDPDRPGGAGAEQQPPDVDPNGFPIAEHRFEHWCSINELLAMAEAYEGYRKRAIEDAIAEGTQAPDLKNRDPRVWLVPRTGSSGVAALGHAEASQIDGQENSQLRERIRSLRGLDQM